MTEKPSEQREGRTAEELAKELVYSVRGWGTKSPEFMVAMTNRWTEKLADFALSERLKGMEEAAKLSCIYCREESEDPSAVTYRDGVFHRNKHSGGMSAGCHAAQIRKAMEVTR